VAGSSAEARQKDIQSKGRKTTRCEAGRYWDDRQEITVREAGI
jgi:hypothetical protein